MEAARAAYRTYVATLLKLAGIADSAGKGARHLDLETKIAKAQENIVDSQDVAKANNVWRAGDFARHAPGLDWASYFSGAGLDRVSSFYVWQPTAAFHGWPAW